MKKILIAITLLFSVSFNAHAVLVSAGSYLLDDAGFVSSLDSFSGSVFSSNSSASAITDSLLDTWIYSPDGSGSVNLSFSNAIYNDSGDDLLLFFLHGSDTGLLGPETSSSVNLNVNGSSVTVSSSLFYSNPQQTDYYGVVTPQGTFGLSVAQVEFSDFGVALNDSVNNLSIGLGSNNYLALVSGLHLEVAPIPLPAPLLLLLSGLAAFGVLGRRGKQ